MKYTGKGTGSDHWGQSLIHNSNNLWISTCACGWKTFPYAVRSSAAIALYQHVRDAQ